LLINPKKKEKKNEERQHTCGWEERECLISAENENEREREREREREKTLCEKKRQEERRRWSPVFYDFGILI